MCVNSGGNQVCACASNYVWTGSVCSMGPSAVTTSSSLEYTIDLSRTSSTFGTLNLDLLPSSTTWDTSVNVYPDEGILKVDKNSATSYGLSLLSELTASKTFVLEVSATSGSFKLTQIVTIDVKSSTQSTEDLNIFLIQGSRKDTVVADLSRLVTDGDAVRIQTADDTARALFAVTQNGKVICGRDISLDGVTNNNSVAHEYDFSVVVQRDGSNKTIAELEVLIFKDRFESSVRENWNGVIMKYSLASNSHFQVELTNVPSVAQISQDGRSIKLDNGVDYDSSVEKYITFEIQLKTTDGSQKTSVQAVIAITDENDEAPKMVTNINGEKPILDYYVFEVLAGSSEGTIIGVVSSTDKDTVGTTSYMLGGRFKDDFSVDNSGTVRCTSALTKSYFGSQFDLTVSVSDGVRSSTPVNVQVFLRSLFEIDRNLNLTFTASVEEQGAAGQFVTNVSVRGYNNYNFTYWYPLNMFTIDATTGVVRTKRALDRETDQNPTDFSVQAVLESEDQCQLVIIGQLVVTLQDVNDQPPRFSQTSYTASMAEMSARGTTIVGLFDIEVKDDDEGQNANLRFSLSGPSSSYFEVETLQQTRFTIKTSGNLVDLESLPYNSINFTVIAVDTPLDTSRQLTGSADIIITVQDVNDNSPVFSPLSVQNVPEEVPSRDVMTVTATDRDRTNTRVTYKLASGGSGFFEVDQYTGILRTTQELDRESIPQFTLTIWAVDAGRPPRTGTTTVTVNVEDKNDNSPVSSQQFETTVTEGGCVSSTTLLTVTATDADSGSNGLVTYTSSDSYFTVTTDGHIRCRSPLDYEVMRSHLINIVATDQGSPPLSTTIIVEVNVEDINDNSPVFSSPSYSVQMKRGEWFSNKPILVLDVVDEDSGSYGDITLTSGNAMFSISGSNTGVLRVVDTAQKPTGAVDFTFNVTATDGGGQSGTTRVTVSVTAEDNSKVRFKLNDFAFSMEENKDYSSLVIGTVEAQYDPGVSAVFSVVDEPDFQVNPTTGDITCRTLQDRENVETRSFIVRARESAVSGGETDDIAIVNITVTDINDNPPELQDSGRYFFYVKENHLPGENIAWIQATDKDIGENAEHQYIIESQSPVISFSIDDATGWIKVARALDREANSDYNLTVKVSDKGTPSLSATTTVRIVITDVNDVTPYFNDPGFDVVIKESSAVGDAVMELSALDEDYGDNGTVTYHVRQPNSCPLSISNKGEITLAEELDYETAKQHECVILVKDMTGCTSTCEGQLTGTTTVTVIVQDVNDNPPLFENAPYTTSISRNAAIGELVTNLTRANDKDSTHQGYGVVKFFILSVQDYFGIDRDSGEITVATSLYNIEGDTVVLLIEARDTPQDDIELRTQTNVTITLVSDSPRPFFNQTFGVTLTEHDKPSDAVLMTTQAYVPRSSDIIACSDPSECVYQLETSNWSSSFRIDPVTGDLRQNDVELNREEIGNTVRLKVKVTDRKTNEFRTTEAFVNLLDINDNLPYFENLTSDFIVKQSAELNSIIGTLTSTDRDLTNNPEYHINQLDITEDLKIGLLRNGTLYVKQSLHAWNKTITFDVEVRDGDVIEASNDTAISRIRLQRVSVHVRDANYNENAPVFSKMVYQGSVEELSKKGTTVAVKELKATDADNDTINYSIVDGNIRDVFVIDTSTAGIFLQYDLDDTVPDTVNISVIAVDDGSPPKTGSCTVKITIQNPTPLECIRKSDYEALSVDSNQRTLFLGLFIAMAILLTAVIIYAIIATYKWRTAASRGGRYQQNIKEVNTGKDTGSGYDKLDGPKTSADYRGIETVDFSSQPMHNPGYVSGGSTQSRAPCVPPRGEPTPDYPDQL